MLPHDIWGLRQPTQPALSPNGCWTAYVIAGHSGESMVAQRRIALIETSAIPIPVTNSDHQDPCSMAGFAPLCYVTDIGVEADTPVWSPDSRTLMFRARSGPGELFQLFVKPVVDEAGQRVQMPARQVTALPFHPWAPKWRRKPDRSSAAGYRDLIYFMAATPRAPGSGYDFLEFNTPLVGWWNNLTLPLRNWRIYELDLEEPHRYRDVLGHHQPLFDFVNGIWNCWDVHPQARELAFCTVSTESYQDGTDSMLPRGAAGKQLPDGVNLDIVRLKLHDDRVPVVNVTFNNFEDDYRPRYSHGNNGWIVFGEKKRTTLAADFPTLKRVGVSYSRGGLPTRGRSVDLVTNSISRGAHKDLRYISAWEFASDETLVYAAEFNGRVGLYRINVSGPAPSRKHEYVFTATHSAYGNGPTPAYILNNNPYSGPERVVGILRELPREKAHESENRRVIWSDRGSIHEFSPRVVSTGNGRDSLRIAHVTSSFLSPPELYMDLQAITNWNCLLRSKICRCVEVEELFVEGDLTAKDVKLNNYPTWYHGLPEKQGGHKPTKMRLQVFVLHRRAGNSTKSPRPLPAPLIQLIHGGPAGAWRDEFHPRFNAPLLASQGYMVAAVNFRGSTGLPGGEVSAMAVLGAWELPVRDLERSTAELIHRGYVATDRSKNPLLGIVGGSYGSYLGARLVGGGANPEDPKHIYRAAVLHAGVYDPLHQFSTDACWVQKDNFGTRPWTKTWKDDKKEIHRLTHFERKSGRYPNVSIECVADEWDIPNRPKDWQPRISGYPFERISALLNCKGGFTDDEVAVLITHGLDDLRVSWSQSVLLHRMLLAKKATSRLLLFPGMGHRIDIPQASIIWWNEVLELLARRLLR